MNSCNRCATIIRRKRESMNWPLAKCLAKKIRRRRSKSAPAWASPPRSPLFPPIWPRAISVWRKFAIPSSAAIVTRLRIAPIAGRDGRLSSNCPTTGRARRWPDLQCVRSAGRSMKIPPTGVFTPSRSPAQSADRMLNCSIARAITLPGAKKQLRWRRQWSWKAACWR